MATKKPTLKSVTQAFTDYKQAARIFIAALKNPVRRVLLSIDATDKDGRLNGITAAELITIANLTDATGERVFLSAVNKTITFIAVSKPPMTPINLNVL